MAKDFIKDDGVVLVLGDNIFFGHDLQKVLRASVQARDGATVFAYHVRDPQQYGVVELNERGEIVSVQEKPKAPRSNLAVVGLYVYDKEVTSIAQELVPSPRGELEITDINLEYLRRGKLHATILGRGFAWLDTGTYDSLHEASGFVRTVQERQGLQVACLEEIAFRLGYLTAKDLERIVESLPQSGYRSYLAGLGERS